MKFSATSNLCHTNILVGQTQERRRYSIMSLQQSVLEGSKPKVAWMLFRLNGS
jgi:hypothetical protein